MLDSGESKSYMSKELSNANSSDETQMAPREFNNDAYNGSTAESESITTAREQVEISRTLSRHLTNSQDLISEVSKNNEPIPRMGSGRDYPPPVGDSKPYSVDYDGPDDPIHPHNWKLQKKLLSCFAVGFSALAVSMGSAIFAEGANEVESLYNVGETVATLGTSLFVFGFASGPIIWGPLSELFGRKIVLLPSGFIYACFCFAVAVSKDVQSVMICRFFSGFLGAAPFVAAPAAMTDLFDNRTRGLAIAVFAMMLFGGPILAPIIGGFVVKNPHMGWRWLSYLTGILASASVVALAFLYEESHHPVILIKKAETLRRRTGNWAIHAPIEEVSLDLKEIVEKNIFRPLKMLFTEPIIFLISLYNAFIYGILYLCLTAVPLVFSGQYGFSEGVAQLPYLAMLIGVFIGGGLIIWMDQKYIRVMEANGGKPVPEERLPPMMVGGIFFAAGLFWLCWSGDFPDKVHWIVPTLGAGCIGIGLIMVFLPCMNYIIDCYLLFAASALAAMTLLRSSFGAAFPLFAMQMFVNMKIKWAGTLLGCIAVVLIPVPFLFYKYGHKVRDKSKFAFVL